MTIPQQSESISQLPECISKRPESHLTAAREHLLVANEQPQRPPSIFEWLEGLYLNYFLVHADQFVTAKEFLREAREHLKAAREHLTDSQRTEYPTSLFSGLKKNAF